MNEADTRAEYIDKQLEAAGWITGGDGGATRQAITKAQIENFRICFPINTTTQITITEKLDGDKVRCDELAIFYREKATNLSALKSSLLG